MPHIHEDLTRQHAVRAGSDRSLGFVLAAALLVFALAPLRNGHGVRVWALAVAAVLAIGAAVAPRVLHPLNRAWTLLGLALNRVTQPILVGAVFFLAVLPVGLLRRAMGKTSIRLARDPGAATYWTPRATAGSPMERQF